MIFMWQQGKIPFYEKPPKTDPDAPLKTIDSIMEMAPIDDAPQQAVDEGSME